MRRNSLALKMDKETAFELELEDSILNGAIDDAFALPKIEDDTNAQDYTAPGGSAPIGFEMALHDPSQVEVAKAKGPMRNPSRERLKRELGFLREYASELEEELNTLRYQKRPLDPANITNSEDTMALTMNGATPWKNAADTERVKRLRSERENERLRRSLETQLRVAEQLSLYLHERAAAATTTYEMPTHIPPTVVSASFHLVVSHLLSDIDRAYAVTSSVFVGSNWESLPDERVFVTTVKTRQYDGSEQMYIELMDTAYRSFPYARSCEAAWEATRMVCASESRVIDVGPCTEDVIAVRYRTTGETRRGMPKDLLVTFVAKKFVERDRMVIVWRTANKPAQHGDSDMPMQAVNDETGWMVITKIPEGVEKRPAGTAYFQACSRLVPAWFEGDVADSSVRTQLAIGEFTNVVLSATEADVTGFETTFQRLVLDDADDSRGLRDTTPRHPSDASETLVAFV